MPTSPYQTLGNIRSAVINDAKEASSTNLIMQVNRWVNEGYEQVVLRKKRDWLDTSFTVQVYSCTQAVCTVTNSSQTVVFDTASLSVYPSSLEMQFHTTGFNEIYNGSTWSSSTLTLANDYLGETNTAASGVFFQPGFMLDSSIRTIYQIYHQWNPSPLIEVGPQEMRAIQERFGPQTDYAQYCTIFGQNSTGQRRVILYPYPNTAYTLYIDANTYVTPLSADADEPVIPMQHRQILYHFALYKLFSYHRNDAKAGEYLTNFNSMLAKLDGESKANQDFPQLQVRYPRGARRNFTLNGFDTRYREEP